MLSIEPHLMWMVRVMAEAYGAALKTLRLASREDLLTELIACKIIEGYRAGEHDAPRLCAPTLQKLGVAAQR